MSFDFMEIIKVIILGIVEALQSGCPSAALAICSWSMSFYSLI